mgnify:CR=1 FL=1
MQIYTYFRIEQNLCYFCALLAEMIQRIQTVFLFIAALSAAALHFTGMDAEVFGSEYIVAAMSLVSFIEIGRAHV